jgi:hypothetical protein
MSLEDQHRNIYNALTEINNTLTTAATATATATDYTAITGPINTLISELAGDTGKEDAYTTCKTLLITGRQIDDHLSDGSLKAVKERLIALLSEDNLANADVIATMKLTTTTTTTTPPSIHAIPPSSSMSSTTTTTTTKSSTSLASGASASASTTTPILTVSPSSSPAKAGPTTSSDEIDASFKKLKASLQDLINADADHFSINAIDDTITLSFRESTGGSPSNFITFQKTGKAITATIDYNLITTESEVAKMATNAIHDQLQTLHQPEATISMNCTSLEDLKKVMKLADLVFTAQARIAGFTLKFDLTGLDELNKLTGLSPQQQAFIALVTKQGEKPFPKASLVGGSELGTAVESTRSSSHKMS